MGWFSKSKQASEPKVSKAIQDRFDSFQWTPSTVTATETYFVDWSEMDYDYVTLDIDGDVMQWEYEPEKRRDGKYYARHGHGRYAHYETLHKRDPMDRTTCLWVRPQSRR